jgi:probable DNA metabolism protein
MMYNVTIERPDDLDAFRLAARRLLAARVPPSDVAWTIGATRALFDEPLPLGEKIAAVPRAFVTLASAVVCHRDEQRWSLLYEALWRIDQGERALLERPADSLVCRLQRMGASVRRDHHRMTAFVRFRKVPDQDEDLYVAWYEPQHYVLRRASAFFIDRFANMEFSILTPDLTLRWDRKTEQFCSGLRREDALSEDVLEDWWRQYYAAVFNPARANAQLMQRHMPKRFWRDLPEARAIVDLIDDAGARTNRMIKS